MNLFKEKNVCKIAKCRMHKYKIKSNQIKILIRTGPTTAKYGTRF